MPKELLIDINTISSIIASVVVIVSSLIAVYMFFWRKYKNKPRYKLSKAELSYIRNFDQQDETLEWSEGMERIDLKISESLVKKGYLQECFSSPSRAIILFELTDQGKAIYKKLIFDTYVNIIKTIKTKSKIFPDKTGLISHASESEVKKVIKLMEDEGELIPLKSDNRETLFWTWVRK